MKNTNTPKFQTLPYPNLKARLLFEYLWVHFCLLFSTYFSSDCERKVALWEETFEVLHPSIRETGMCMYVCIYILHTHTHTQRGKEERLSDESEKRIKMTCNNSGRFFFLKTLIGSEGSKGRRWGKRFLIWACMDVWSDEVGPLTNFCFIRLLRPFPYTEGALEIYHISRAIINCSFVPGEMRKR